jgi:protein-export membrane protein SecD
MDKYRTLSIVLIVIFGLAVYFNYSSQIPGSWSSKFAYKYGLDLVGGTELIYKADVSAIDSSDVSSAMETLQDVIERRVNVFGVSEPLVQVERSGIISGSAEERLIVELPGYKDIEEAKKALGKTPLLEFRLEKDGARSVLSDPDLAQSASVDELFTPTELTGRYLKRARLEFENTGQSVIALEFNSDGSKIFAGITKGNIGKILAIFLDGELIEAPVIQDEIVSGSAVITGITDAVQAKEIVRQLNYGALPLPIELVSTQTVGATLGERALNAGVSAGIWGFILIAIFLIVWYRLPGLIASVALVMYVAFSLTVFKLVFVTLTVAGIAGFILSIGMAVDANILIFERMKEELRRGRDLATAIKEGFHRAWLSIRDSNISSIITAVILFWLGTSAVKGFALTLGIGVLVSMFTAITVSRTFLFAINIKGEGKAAHFLFGSGIGRPKPKNLEPKA